MEGLDTLIKGKVLYDKKISGESSILWQSASLTNKDKKFLSLELELDDLIQFYSETNRRDKLSWSTPKKVFSCSYW